MAQMSIDVPDEVYAELRRRVTADITMASQVRAALAEYLRHGTKAQREAELVVNAQHG